MTVTAFDSLPSNEEVFGQSTYIQKAVSKSVMSRYPTPLLLLTRPELRNGIPSIGAARSSAILRQLKEHGLGIRDTNRSVAAVVDDLFGCIEDAPISALQCLSASVNGTTTTQLAPLRCIQRLEMVNKRMSVRNLVGTPREVLITTLALSGDQERRSAETSIEELRMRLRAWDLNLSPT